MPRRGVPQCPPARRCCSRLGHTVACEPWHDGLASSKISRNKRAKPAAIAPTASGRQPSRGTHLDGVRNAAQKSQSVHSRPSLSVNERAVSYRLSWLLLPCTAAPSPLTVLGCVEGPRQLPREKQFGFCSGRDITKDAVNRLATVRLALSPAALPSATSLARSLANPSTTPSSLTVTCRCRVSQELVAKQGLVHVLAPSALAASSLPKSLLRPAANNFSGLRFVSPAPPCSGRTCHHD